MDKNDKTMDRKDSNLNNIQEEKSTKPNTVKLIDKTKNKSHSLRKLIRKNSAKGDVNRKRRCPHEDKKTLPVSCLGIFCLNSRQKKVNKLKEPVESTVSVSISDGGLNKKTVRNKKSVMEDNTEMDFKQGHSFRDIPSVSISSEESECDATSDVNLPLPIDRKSRYSEGDISSHLSASLPFLFAGIRRASSTLQVENLKSPKIDRRPLKIRRNAICEQLEREVIVQGLSLRQWRKIILTNFSLIDFDLRF